MTGDPTQNPYFKAEIKPHYLDCESCRVKCFDVFNIMSVFRRGKRTPLTLGLT